MVNQWDSYYNITCEYNATFAERCIRNGTQIINSLEMKPVNILKETNIKLKKSQFRKKILVFLASMKKDSSLFWQGIWDFKN